MSKVEKFKEDYILFLEAGFIAINQADEDSALKLLKAAELLDPNSSLAKVGFGYLHLHKLELKQAIQCFESVLKKEPDNEMVKTFLGIAKTMTPTQVAEGEKLLAQMQKSPDKGIKQLSETALDFVDRFIKKDSTPVEGRKRKR